MASPPIQTGGAFPAVQTTYQIVQQQIDDMAGRADASLATANSVIQSLTNFTPITPPPDPSPPNVDAGSFVVKPATATAPSVPAGLVSGIDDLDPVDLKDGADLVADLNDIDAQLDAIPPFSPSITAITIPEAPSPIQIDGLPVAPTLDAITLPDQPDIALPSLDDLEPVTIPSFTFPTLPDFDAVAPTFDGELPSLQALAQYNEQAYTTEVIGDVVATVRLMLQGKTGLPTAIEQAIYDRARTREDQGARQIVQQAHDTFAGRGFEMPPGMLVEQVNAAQTDAALRTNAASREVAIEVTRIAIENVRQAVAQGIAAEQTLYNIFNNAAQRSFEMARARLDAEVSLFNAQVSLFNAKQTAYQVAAQVFEAKLRAKLAELEVYKAQIDGAQAISALNESKTRIYTAKVEALRTLVDRYRVLMEASKIQSETNKTRIESYRASVEAYGQVVSARKVEFDAYEAQVRAESAKVGIVQAQAEAYSATIRGIEGKSNIKVAKVRSRIEALQARVGEYTAKVGFERERVGAQAQVAQAKISAFSADVQRYSADLQAQTSANEAQIRSTDAYIRTQLSQYEIAVRRYDALLQTIVQQASIQADSIRAAGQMASSLASSAFAAMHVQASVDGGGRINYSESLGTDVNYSTEF